MSWWDISNIGLLGGRRAGMRLVDNVNERKRRRYKEREGKRREREKIAYLRTTIWQYSQNTRMCIVDGIRYVLLLLLWLFNLLIKTKLPKTMEKMKNMKANGKSVAVCSSLAALLLFELNSIKTVNFSSSNTRTHWGREEEINVCVCVCVKWIKENWPAIGKRLRVFTIEFHFIWLFQFLEQGQSQSSQYNVRLCACIYCVV